VRALRPVLPVNSPRRKPLDMTNNDRFIDYCLDFYGDESSIYKLGFTREQISLATELYQLKLKQSREKFCGDTVDREHVCELILTFKGE
jgi:hypothetical protein